MFYGKKMKVLKLKLIDITPSILSFLERRELIRAFRPTHKALRVGEGECVVEKIYSTAPRFGTHKLICVGKNETKITLTTHPDNEDLILINPANYKFKPLYLVIGVGTKRELERKAVVGGLKTGDIMALCLKYNDPKTCAFTILKGAPHCEVTVPGRGIAPVFFVTEPSDFEMNNVNLHKYQLELDK